MSPSPQGKGNDMALVLPGKVPPVRVEREIHPAICLLTGFGFIALMATGVHVLFGLF
jgi:hypothetical protein